MDIYINKNKITGMSLFKIIWRGWVVGLSAIFIPVFILAGFSANPELFKSSPSPFLFALLVPLIAAFQGVIFAGIILLGLKLFPLKHNDNR